MTAEKLILKPGINTQQTPLLNESGFSQSQLIRFFQGMVQKIGGWSRLTNSMLVGVSRGLFAWADLTGNGWIAAGTEQRLTVYNAGNLYDITPIRGSDNVSAPFSTVASSKTITVQDSGNNASVGDWINVLTPTAVGGIVLQGLYRIVSIVDAAHYTITAANPALSTVTNGGATTMFSSTNGSNVFTATLANNGFSVGSIYTVYVSTTLASVTLYGQYLVASVTNANTFTFTVLGAANATGSTYENGDNVRIQYLLPTGLASPSSALGYGEGAYGLGPYGYGGNTSSLTPLRQWSLGNFGRILIANPNYGGLYSWDPASGTFENPATLISGAPAVATGFFIASQQQQIIAYGITDSNTNLQDPMLVGWCDVGNFNVWTASATNQAGTYRLARGSRIVGGIQGPQYGMLWTDLGLWIQQYIGFPLVYGFNEVGQGCGLGSMRSAGVLCGQVYWRSPNQFNTYTGGSVQPLPCSVWDIFFRNANFSVQDKFLLAPNSPFNEFFYFYVSLTGSGEVDSYVKYNQVDGVWDYGTLERTAWFDQNVVLSNNPIGVDGNALIQQHESSPDADGVPILASVTTGWAKINDGLMFVFLERIIPDFVSTSGAVVQITAFMADYPDDIPRQYGPFDWTIGQTQYIIIRGRGRLAKLQFSSSDLGSFWRLGECLYFASPTGYR